MADDRPDLRNELSSLWKSTKTQLDGLGRELGRQATTQKARLDLTLLRQRLDKETLALGKAVLEAIDDDELELPQSLDRALDRVRAVQAEIEEEQNRFDELRRADDQARTGETAEDDGDDNDVRPARTRAVHATDAPGATGDTGSKAARPILDADVTDVVEDGEDEPKG